MLMLPNHARILDSRDVDLGWARATRYRLERTASATQGGAVQAVETHVIAQPAGKRAYDFYAVAAGEAELGRFEPILDHMLRSAVAGAAPLPVAASARATSPTSGQPAGTARPAVVALGGPGAPAPNASAPISDTNKLQTPTPVAPPPRPGAERDGSATSTPTPTPTVAAPPA